MMLSGSTKRTPATMLIFPPVPAKALARILLFFRMTNWGSMKIFPPVVVVTSGLPTLEETSYS